MPLTIDDRGTGLVGTLAGVTAFLVFLLLATQVLFDLYARSAVTAAAFDAARIVAGSDAGATPESERDAEQGARDLLGRYGQGASFSWRTTADTVSLSVRVHTSTILPAFIARPLGLDSIDRTAVVRREYVR